MADVSDWMFRRLEWWPEIGAGLGVLVGAVRGFVEGGRTVGLPALGTVAALFAAAAFVHWLTKRAYFDRHLEHFLASQYSSGLLLFALGMGLTKDVIRAGTLEDPLFHLAYAVVVGGLLYWVIFVLARRSFVRQWNETEPDHDDEN